jgi:hypothetical protein
MYFSASILPGNHSCAVALEMSRLEDGCQRMQAGAVFSHTRIPDIGRCNSIMQMWPDNYNKIFKELKFSQRIPMYTHILNKVQTFYPHSTYPSD